MIKKQTYSEEQLTALLQNKEGIVIEYLYQNYSKALKGVILNIVREEEVAEDLLQEVFVKIWGQSNTYDKSKGRVFTWLLNIARNHSIDYLRSKQFKNDQRNQKTSDTIHEVDQKHNVTIDIDIIGIRELVEKLDIVERDLIGLSYYMGHTHDEIAKKLNMPLGTVKTKLRTALIKLRKLVN